MIYIITWISKILDLLSALVGIFTLGFYDPMWGFWFMRWGKDKFIINGTSPF